MLVACEGQSERSYGTLVGRLAHELKLPVAIRAEVCGHGGGDFLKCAWEARQLISAAKRSGVRYASRALLVDTDRAGESPDRDKQAIEICEHEGIQIIWQDKDHEGFLLRHMENCQRLRPDSGNSIRELRKLIPGYEKGMPSTQLGRFIDTEAISRAATVEPLLRDFLDEIDWPL